MLAFKTDVKDLTAYAAKSTIHKIIRDGAYNVLTLVIPGIFLIIATPFLVRLWGLELYGVWVICSTLLGLFGLLDFGLQETAITYVPKYIQQGNDEELSTHLNCLLSLGLISGGISALILFAGSSFLAVKLFSISKEYQADSIWAFRILSVGILPNLSVLLLSAVAMGFQRFDVSMIFIVWRNLINMGGVCIIAFLTRRLTPVIVWSVFTNWAFVIIGIWGLRRMIPTIKIFRIPSKQRVKKTLAFSRYTFLSNVCLLAMGVFDKLIIGALFGASAAAVYSIPMSGVAKIEQIFVKFSQVIFPRLSKLAGVNASNGDSRESLKGIGDLSLDASLLAALGAGVFLFVFSEPLLRVWMGDGFAHETKWLLRGLVVGYTLKMFSVIPSYILYSLEKPQITSVANGLSGLLYIGLIIILGRGVSLGVLSFCSGAYLISFLILGRAILSNMEKGMSWHLWPYLTSAVLSGTIVEIWSLRYQMSDVKTIILGGALLAALYLGMCFLFTVFEGRSNSLRFSVLVFRLPRAIGMWLRKGS